MPLEKVGVDQSGRIEQSEDHTGIVYCPLSSEKPNYKIFISKTTSSKLNKHRKPRYRDKGKFLSKLYAACLYYLLHDVTEDIDEIVMEEEYTGKMDQIVNTTCNWIRDISGNKADTDQFTIQERQPHFKPDVLANKVREGEVNADRELKYGDFTERL